MKKEILSLIGLITTTALAVISGGLINPAVTSIFGSVSANFLTTFPLVKIKKWFINIHPNDLNHNVKKLFIESVQEALNNIFILFSETQVSDSEKKQVKQLIKTLQKHLPEMLSNGTQIQIEEPEIKHFFYENDDQDVLSSFIENQFANFGITEPFKSFLAKNLPAQIQLCFGEGLKDPANQNAWIAFQRMLIEEIRSNIKQIANTQQNIKDDLSDLKFEKSVFSQEQIAEIHELIKILNNKKLVEVKIKNSINQSLKSIEDKANEIIRITTKTQLTVDELKIIIEKIKRQNRTNHIIIYMLSVFLLVAGIFVVNKLINQPFNISIQIVDWNNRTDNQDIYNKGAIICFDSKKEYNEELTITNNGKFTFHLPASYNKRDSVRIHLEKPEYYQFMELDTTIIVQKNSTYYLKMYFKGIDKITRKIFDSKTGEPIINAIAEIQGLKDTTDAEGKFTIILPPEKQKRYQELTIKKTGYIDYVNKNFDMTANNKYIQWELKKK